MLEKAKLLVEKYHRPQFRKLCGESYANHLYRVYDTVSFMNGTEEQLIIALLHDLIEDVDGIDYEFINSEFNHEISNQLSYITEDKDTEWFTRKENYLSSVISAPFKVQQVFLADKYDNISSIVEFIKTNLDIDWSVFEGGLSALEWFWTKILNVISNFSDDSENYKFIRTETIKEIEYFLTYCKRYGR